MGYTDRFYRICVICGAKSPERRIEETMENMEMEVLSGGGHIIMGNVSQAVRAQTRGGDIIIGDISGRARIFTGGGHIEVGKVAGDAMLKTCLLYTSDAADE